MQSLPLKSDNFAANMYVRQWNLADIPLVFTANSKSMLDSEVDKYDRRGEMLGTYITNKCGILPFLHNSFIDHSGKTKCKNYKGPAHLV